MSKIDFIKIKLVVSFRYICLIFFLPLIIIFGLIIKLIKPLILIRWSRLDNARIGHFATNIEIYLLEKKFKIGIPNGNYIDFFYKPELKICNKQLDQMWKDKINILPWFVIFPLEFLRQRKILFNDDNTFQTTSKDQYNLLDKSNPILSFSTKEEQKGLKFLKKIGLSENSKFVCLQVRDDAYLSNEKYKYHDYRNSDVENFKDACNFLADQNIYVFRMGSKVRKKISFSNSKIIDYATNGMRTEFLDIYLGSKCLFWISTGSGIDNMSKLFRKPILYVNQVPIGHITTFQKTAVIIFKHFFNSKNNKKLNLEDLQKKDLCFATTKKKFDEENVIIEENDPKEIKEATREMYKRVREEFWDEWNETKVKQKVFWNKFPYERKLHGNITANIGKNFLLKNENFYN